MSGFEKLRSWISNHSYQELYPLGFGYLCVTFFFSDLRPLNKLNKQDFKLLYHKILNQDFLN